MSTTYKQSPVSEEEKVLAIPRDLIEKTLLTAKADHTLFQGFLSIEDSPAIRHLIKNKTSQVFLPRSGAETDPAHKQLIPYVVIKQNAHYFSYLRSKSGGESRLHGRRSIGIGGHINHQDQSLAHGIARELQEEMTLPKNANSSVHLAGLINDDTNAVGAVHLGVVYILELPPGERPQSADPALQDLRPCTPAELRATLQEYESWSQILIPNLW